jgi:hypothetical protein
MSYSPKQLYLEFSSNYCDNSVDAPTGSRGRSWGFGARLDTEALSDLLKLMPHSTFTRYIKNIDSTENIVYKAKFKNFQNSGNGKLSLPYKFLQILDPDAFKEVQRTKLDGPAHAIRNAADVSRACNIFWKSRESLDPDDHYFYDWEGRGAVEPMIIFASNKLPECLFFCGLDFITSTEAKYRRNGQSAITFNQGELAEGEVPSISDAQLENVPGGMAGIFTCKCPPGGLIPPPCPCDCCDEDAVNDPGNENCFQKPQGQSDLPAGCVDKSCQKIDEKNVNENTFNFKNIPSLSKRDKDSVKTHAGYFIRKSYGGLGNFKTVGDYFGIDDISVLLGWARSQNGFNYSSTVVDEISKFKTYKKKRTTTKYPLERIKTVSLVTEISQIRDLLHNGYGLIFATNVGFSDRRDSIGISYPDRLWYQTLSIIGCDDRKKLYPETLFLIQNSWGKWNYGGHPDWGPIPDGSFLITESHLKAIIGTNGGGIYNFENFVDCRPPLNIYNCYPSYNDEVSDIFFRPPTSLVEGGIMEWQPSIRSRGTTPVLYKRATCIETNGKSRVRTYASLRSCMFAAKKEAQLNCCGDQCTNPTPCDFTECGSNQKPWGYVLAVSFEDEPPYIRKDMRYTQFFRDKTGAECDYDVRTFGLTSASAGWEIVNACSFSENIEVNFIFEDSTNCEGSNNSAQGGEFSCAIVVPTNRTKARIRISGNPEAQDAGFDKGTLVFAGETIQIESKGDNSACSSDNQTIISKDISVVPGATYVLKCTTSTIDANYHKDMKFYFSIIWL